MNMEFKRKLPIPKEIKEQYPITPELEAIKAKRDAEKQQMIKDNVMTQKNQEFVNNKSDNKTFTSFKSQQTM